MIVFKKFEDIIHSIIRELIVSGSLPDHLSFKGVTVQAPRNPDHGEITSNVAMVLAKRVKMIPYDLAKMIKERLSQNPDIESIDIAGPGFINLRLKLSFWHHQLAEVITQNDQYGRSDIADGALISVEYVSANPTGLLHIGHARGAIFGDALANLLEFTGFKVSRDYYVNDAGRQIVVLAHSAYVRYSEALGVPVEQVPEEFYPGEYLIPVGHYLVEVFGDKYLGADPEEWVPVFSPLVIDAMMKEIRQDLKDLGVSHDIFFSEKLFYENNKINKVVELLRSKELIYSGTLPPPKGKVQEEWEAQPQMLFKSTDFGDDMDRPLQKSDKSWTYFAADIAYHYEKYIGGSSNLVNILGADHGGYIHRISGAVKAFSDGKCSFDGKLVQMVNLFKDGQPLKMSKRAGVFVTMRQLLDEVGSDVLRFIMLTRKNNDVLDFDLSRVLEQSKDNPVFYVQYAHARAHSVIKKAEDEFPDIMSTPADLSMLNRPEEIAVIQELIAWPLLVTQAARAHEPHRITFFLNDFAALVHQFWAYGKSDPSLRFVIKDNLALTRARLALAQAIYIVIANGLSIIGVAPVKEM